MYKGIELKIYPNKKQKELIAKTFGCTRLVYNKALDLRKSKYENEGITIFYKDTNEMLTLLKKDEDFAFLNEIDSIALQQSLRDLDRAYKNFFKSKFGYPKFKSKKDNHKSYRTQNVNNNICVTLDYKYIKIPKLGYVKTRNRFTYFGKVNNATIIQKPSGKYYCVLDVEVNEVIKSNNGGIIGLDMGISSFYTTSTGYKCDNFKYYHKANKKLARMQRKLSRQIESHIIKYEENRKPVYDKSLLECKNIQKQRIKIAKLQEYIANQRYDFLHKETLKLCKENQFIAVEDLSISNMIKNHHLASDIQDVSWSKFLTILEYKCKKYNTTLIKVPRFYASSQICSCCGHQNKDIKNLAIRKWTCLECGTVHDRDINAAKNILNKALSM